MKTDFLVIGSGAAGLSFALKAAAHGHVTIVTKGAIEECNTNYAQGGICSVTYAPDTFEKHIRDTLVSVGANAVVPFPPPQPFKASERRRMAAAVCPFFMNSSLSLKIRNAPVPSSLRTDIPVSPTVRISRTDVRYF